jgi:hypothetical protein
MNVTEPCPETGPGGGGSGQSGELQLVQSHGTGFCFEPNFVADCGALVP